MDLWLVFSYPSYGTVPCYSIKSTIPLRPGSSTAPPPHHHPRTRRKPACMFAHRHQNPPPPQNTEKTCLYVRSQTPKSSNDPEHGENLPVCSLTDTKILHRPRTRRKHACMFAHRHRNPPPPQNTEKTCLYVRSQTPKSSTTPEHGENMPVCSLTDTEILHRPRTRRKHACMFAHRHQNPAHGMCLCYRLLVCRCHHESFYFRLHLYARALKYLR